MAKTKTIRKRFGIGFERDVSQLKYMLRRPSHHPFYLAVNKGMLKVNRITHSRYGITIFCDVEGVDHELKLEHFDVWCVRGAATAIRLYFDTLTDRQRRRISRGPMKELYEFVYYGTAPLYYESRRTSRRNNVDEPIIKTPLTTESSDFQVDHLSTHRGNTHITDNPAPGSSMSVHVPIM